MKKIIVHHRSPHHAINSGYARFTDFIDDVTLINGNKQLFPHSLAKILASFANQDYGLYTTYSLLKEIEILKELLVNKEQNKIIHFLNAERDIRNVIRYKNNFSNLNTFATFHKPPTTIIKTITKNKILKKVDNFICVGNNQVDFIKNWLNNENVRYIPHGVDTNFFKPDVKIKKTNSILFVGQHLRDFDALNYAIPILKQKIPNLIINIVLRNGFEKKINNISQVNFFSGIDDYKLLQLYNEAKLLFLPLIDVTACNSILEAMSSGLPIITTDVGGNKGYLKNDFSILVPQNDYFGLVDETIKIFNDENKLLKMSNQATINANQFSWVNVSKQILDFYNIKS